MRTTRPPLAPRRTHRRSAPLHRVPFHPTIVHSSSAIYTNDARGNPSFIGHQHSRHQTNHAELARHTEQLLSVIALLHHRLERITHTADDLLRAAKYYMGEQRNTPTARQWIAGRQSELDQDDRHGMSAAEASFAHRVHQERCECHHHGRAFRF